jgi:hypothetical protein
MRQEFVENRARVLAESSRMNISDRLSRLARDVAAAALIAAAGVAGAAAVGTAATAHAAVEAHTVSTPVVFGDPEASAENWQIQTLEDSCVLMSVASVVGDLTGDLPTEREMVRLAGGLRSVVTDGVIYSTTDDVSGTMMPDALTLLDHFGIEAGITDSERESESGIDTGIDALARHLRAGSGIIVSLNSNVIWDGDGDRTKANHAVAVTGIDVTNGIVHLNDSALDGGADKQVSLAVFEKAWRTSDHRMIVTE